MPRPRAPHLHHEKTRHGTWVWYVRVGKGPRIRLRATYGTDEFNAEYQDAVAGKLRPRDSGPANGTLGWLVAQYRASSTWLALSPATRRQRENILRQVLSTAAAQPLGRIDRRAIIDGRERRAKTPFQARHFLNTMRALFAWAVDNDLAKSDPTAGLTIKKPRTDGFEMWTEDEIARFEARWPRGTRQRVMFDLFLYTGLRRGDVAVLGKQHVTKGVIMIDTEKTGTRVTIPMLPALARTLKCGPVGDLAFVASADGQPMTKEVIGNLFRAACRAAAVNKSAHGLRKAAATRAVNNGATVAQLEAIFGWEGGRMASLYTKNADRQALARSAMTKLNRGKR